MDVFDAVHTVLAVREYQEKPVPQDVVERIVEAAWLTGSSYNRQPWHFIIVEDREKLRQFGAMVPTGPYIAQAPLAVVVVIEKTQYAESDASRAIQSMILTAWEAGIGSNWVGFYEPEEAKPILGIPEALDILAVVTFGYPTRPLGRGKKNRKPFNEVVSRERY